MLMTNLSKRNLLFSRFFLSALLIAFLSLMMAGCVTGQTATTPTQPLPPAPSAATTAIAEVAAYPPPATGYPAPDVLPATPAADAYPAVATLEPSATDSPVEPVESGAATHAPVYLPFIGEGPAATAEIVAAIAPTALPTATATTPPTLAPSPTAATALNITPTPIAVVDFAAAAAELAAQDQQLAYNKIGFHVTFLEDRDELDGYMQRVDAEGVPFFLKTVDNAEPLYRAQELMKVSGVPHILVYRSTRYDVPDYDMDPILAAETYWELEKAIWPPELDRDLIWFETMNELDKGRSEWLAEFALRTAQLALRDGYRWAAFSWASGEPEPDDWESPAMLELLRLIGENPDQLAIALHEYSYTTDDIGDEYPHKVGRFLDLFRVADAHGIPRPTVLITEWGWTYNEIPAEPNAMEDVGWAARLYGAYPQVLGAAVWNLGKLDDIWPPLNSQMRDLIDNMTALSLDSYFSAPLPPRQAPLDAGQFPPPGD